MVVRTSRYGKFLACPNYPNCKNTKPVPEDEVKQPCPKCGAKLVKRISKKGKKFYGITPIWRVNEKEEKEIGVTFTELREVIRKELEKRGIIHLDGYKMVPHSAEYFEDNVHPNAEGFYQNSINILKEIDRASKL